MKSINQVLQECKCGIKERAIVKATGKKLHEKSSPEELKQKRKATDAYLDVKRAGGNNAQATNSAQRAKTKNEAITSVKSVSDPKLDQGRHATTAGTLKSKGKALLKKGDGEGAEKKFNSAAIHRRASRTTLPAHPNRDPRDWAGKEKSKITSTSETVTKKVGKPAVGKKFVPKYA